MTKSDTAFIIGNGKSREGFDLLDLKSKGTVFGCNALYRNYKFDKYSLPDYLVAIDDPIIAEIEGSDFPSKRVLIPPMDERWEPVELHWGRANIKPFNPARPRSNAGMNAILEAIKKDYKYLYILGFDFLVADKSYAISNMYDGTDCYGYDTRANLEDTRKRLTFLGWVLEKYTENVFTFVYPAAIIKKGIYAANSENFKLESLEDLKSKL